MRPGELTHLLLPDDLDLQAAVLNVRNKPRLGWQVKTRSERAIPLVKPLADVLRTVIADRRTGPVFVCRRFHGQSLLLPNKTVAAGGSSFAILPRTIEQPLTSRGSRSIDASLVNAQIPTVQ
jgi:hypothetical protein